jgi:hypothetical protein
MRYETRKVRARYGFGGEGKQDAWTTQNLLSAKEATVTYGKARVNVLHDESRMLLWDTTLDKAFLHIE